MACPSLLSPAINIHTQIGPWVRRVSKGKAEALSIRHAGSNDIVDVELRQSSCATAPGSHFSFQGSGNIMVYLKIFAKVLYFRDVTRDSHGIDVMVLLSSGSSS